MKPPVRSVDTTDPAVTVAYLDGEIDMSGTSEVLAVLSRAVTNDALGLVVDLSAVSYLDSAGVRLLFELDKELKRHQQELRIVLPGDAFIRRILRIVNMDAHVGVHATVAEAVTDIRRAGIKEGMPQRGDSP